jgi:hypothetical protein
MQIIEMHKLINCRGPQTSQEHKLQKDTDCRDTQTANRHKTAMITNCRVRQTTEILKLQDGTYYRDAQALDGCN